MLNQIAFYIFGGISIICGLGVVSASNPIYVVLWLLGALIAISGIFFSAGAELLGALQLMVYVVAIAVFYILIITAVPWRKLHKNEQHNRLIGVTVLPFIALLYVEAFIVGISGVSITKNKIIEAITKNYGNAEVIGIKLFSTYFWAFELMSVLLLISMIGAIYLVEKRRKRMIEILLTPHVEQYFVLAFILLGIGLFGMMVRKNLITILMSLELALNSVNIALCWHR
jgi:NADH dehydrogenase subunit J (EC 1.6.5.3)